MAKFHGKIGFTIRSEVRPGFFKDEVVEKEYFGDIIKTYKRLETSESVNDNITFSNNFSIIADPYLNNNLKSISYVEFMGAKWKLSSIELQYPRLILTTGGLYNGE